MPRLTNRTPEQVKAFKDAIESGKPLQTAMLDAGYSANVAKHGKSSLPKQLMATLLESGKRYVELGKQITAADQEAFVRGTAFARATEGSDRGAAMLKLLGSDRRVNMFTPDSVVGVIVIGEQPTLDDALRIPPPTLDVKPEE